MFRLWQVYTPDYEKCGFNGIDPPEYGADVINIEAKTSRDAITMAVKIMLADWHFAYCTAQRNDNECPYTGVKAEDITDAQYGQEDSEEEPASIA